MASDRFFEVAEDYALQHMIQLGFDAALTRRGADGGLDIVDHDHTLAVQVKATRTPTGAPVIQQLVGAARVCGLTHVACVSTGGFTRQAMEFAKRAQVALFELDLRGNLAPANLVASDFGPSSGAEAVDHQGESTAFETLGPSASAEDVYIDALDWSGIDDSEALKLAGEACEKGHAAACELAASLSMELGQYDVQEVWLRTHAQVTGDAALLAEFLETKSRRQFEAGDDASGGATLREAADLGSPEAMLTLAKLLFETNKDDDALSWLQRAAESDLAEARRYIARYYLECGRESEAETLYRRLAINGDESSMQALAAYFEQQGRVDAACHWLQELSSRGDRSAPDRLAALQASSPGPPPLTRVTIDPQDCGIDPAIAEAIALKRSGYMTGNMMDVVRAERMLRQAVSSGSRTAMRVLAGQCRSTGRNLEAQMLRSRANRLDANDFDGSVNVRSDLRVFLNPDPD